MGKKMQKIKIGIVKKIKMKKIMEIKMAIMTKMMKYLLLLI